MCTEKITQDFDYKINSLLFEVTTKCNKNCRFCYLGKNACDRHINSNVFNSLIRIIQENDIENIIISGGEPFTYENLYDIIDYLLANNKRVMIITNGISVDVLKLSKYSNLENFKLKISVDLEDYNHIPSLCEILKNHKINHELSITLYDNTWEELSCCLNFIKRFYDNKVQISFPIYKGNAHYDKFKLNQLLVIARELINSIVYENLKIECAEINVPLYNYFVGPKKHFFNCSVCKDIKCDINGFLYPCPYFTNDSYIIGSVFDGIKVEKRNNVILKALKLNQREKCINCKWKNLCSGGCLVKYENEVEADYNCIINNYVYEYLNNIFSLY